MVTFIKASFSLVFKKDLKFKVTPKTVDQTVKQKDKHELITHMAILAAIIAAVMFAMISLFIDQMVNYPSRLAMIVAIFWALMNGVILFLALYEVLKRAYKRSDYRRPLNLKGILYTENGEGLKGLITNISEGGIALTFSKEEGERVAENKEEKCSVGISGEKLRLSGMILEIKQSQDSTWQVRFKFDEIPEDKKMVFKKCLYVIAPREIYENNLRQKNTRRHHMQASYNRECEQEDENA
jgi:cellulose synthase (UDP-forming)